MRNARCRAPRCAVLVLVWHLLCAAAQAGAASGAAPADGVELKPAQAAPRVSIEAARVNGAAVNIDGRVEAPAARGDLQFDYAALPPSDPAHVQFEYQLDDFDQGWIAAGSRRTAYYTNIPPGAYTFRVRAAWPAAGPSEPVALALYLRPRLYETRPFLAGGVLVLVLFLVGGYRWRLRVLRDLQADLMRLIRERTDQLEDANRKLAELSYVDAVTNVSNRRSFEEVLTMEWRRSWRTKSRLSLLMVDVDAFKAFNDALGHRAGDDCLRIVAAVIRDCVLRATDTVARYGGEEFAVVLPDTSEPGAETLAERVRATVEAQNIQHPGVEGGRLTVSIGVATAVGRESVEPAWLVRVADEALYQAKRDGRNAVRISRGVPA